MPALEVKLALKTELLVHRIMEPRVYENCASHPSQAKLETKSNAQHVSHQGVSNALDRGPLGRFLAQVSDLSPLRVSSPPPCSHREASNARDREHQDGLLVAANDSSPTLDVSRLPWLRLAVSKP